MSNSIHETDTPSPDSGWLAQIREKIGTLRYGEVRITVHEGRVTQIERTERLRFDGSATRS